MILHFFYLLIFLFLALAINLGLFKFLITRENYSDGYMGEITNLLLFIIPVFGAFGLIFLIYKYYEHERQPDTIAYRKQHAEWVERVARQRRKQEFAVSRHAQGIYTKAEKIKMAEEKKVMDRWTKAQLGVIAKK